MKRLALVGLALALAACGRAPGVAQGHAGGTAKAAAALPKAIEVVQAARLASFVARDADRDGRLGGEELADAPLGALDRNGDGALSQAEWEASLPPLAQAAQAWLAIQAGIAEEEAAEGLGALGRLGAPASPSGPPVVLLPGYLDLELYFALIKRRLEAAGRPWVYLDLFPNVADIHGAAKRLDALVESTRRAHQAPQVDLVGHSMGGLISRTYLKALGGVPKVRRLVTMATPHHGTYVSHLGPGAGADQMNPRSAFIAWLNSPSEEPLVPTTSVRAGLDEIVLPHDSAILKGADNHLAPLAMHGTILISRRAWAPVARALGL